MHLNTPLTIHGVSKRATGNYRRNLVNIIAGVIKKTNYSNLIIKIIFLKSIK